MDFLEHARKLPVLDWNLTFFGAHEQTVNSEWKVPTEKHYAFECIFIIEGIEYIQIQNKTYTLFAGDLFLIPPEFSHEIWAGGTLKYFCFHFDIDDPDLKVKLIQGIDYYHPYNSELCKKITPHLNKINSLSEDNVFDFNTKMIIQIELSKILQLFYQATITYTADAPLIYIEYSRIMADYMKTQLTNQILNYINNNYIPIEQHIEVNEVIKKIGLSNGYGFRIFKQVYGISPREYLSKLKINEAKKLLMKPNYSITDIGLALGYSELSNFSRQFKRWTDLSPSQFRNKVFKNI